MSMKQDLPGGVGALALCSSAAPDQETAIEWRVDEGCKDLDKQLHGLVALGAL